jgi:acetamidase/formamidase/AraC-like DNA-binding protein
MALMHSQFSTEAYPGDRRAHAWQEALGHISLQLKSLNGPVALFGRTRTVVSPLGISLTRIAASAQDLTGLAAKGEQGVWIALHLSGASRLETPNANIDIAVGDMSYGPLDEPFTLSFASDFRELFILIPQSVLEARGMVKLTRRPGCLRGHDGAEHIFADMLTSVAESVETLTSDQLRPVELALIEFFAACLVEEEPAGGLRGETGTQIHILNRVCQVIEAHLSDADLSHVSVARMEGISARYVQKLFENAGDSFNHYLRLRRLERCRSDLVSARFSHLSITETAFRWGFSDSAHFSRSFREEYGLSPRDYRKQGTATVGAHEQIGRGWPESSGKALRRVASSRNHEWSPDSVDAKRELPRIDNAVSAAIIKPDFTAAPSHKHHHLAANEKTVHWGYFSKSLPPVLTMNSGELVTIEALTHHANDDFDRMIKGDPSVERIFHWTKDSKTIDRRGAGPMDASVYGRGAGEGFGVHLCTGPVAVTGAEPGDVIELRILTVRPRLSANPEYEGRAFGSNAAAWWGFHYKELLTEPKPREVVTIYEIDCQHASSSGRRPGQYGHVCARAAYNFRWTPQRDPNGVLHTTIDYPGVKVDHSTIEKNFNVLKGVKIPLRPHFGVIGLAPREAELIDSIPPSYSGGNLDNWRAGEGASVFLPVSVPGALLSIGDPHASQGDSELCGTAIECSMTGTFQVILHKKGASTDKPIADLDYPLLETDKEWVIHGFSHANYLSEFGDRAQSEIYKNASLDPAMRDAFWKMRRFLMTNKGLTEDEAISLISVAVDFGITQVVDGNLCVHASLRKDLFDDETDTVN